jgi:hypothetical protein
MYVYVYVYVSFYWQYYLFGLGMLCLVHMYLVTVHHALAPLVSGFHLLFLSHSHSHSSQVCLRTRNKK